MKRQNPQKTKKVKKPPINKNPLVFETAFEKNLGQTPVDYLIGKIQSGSSASSIEYLFDIISAEIATKNTGTWFRLALLEAMLFEPYYPLTIETDKKGNAVPCRKYLPIHNPVCGFNKGNADKYLDSIFPEVYYTAGYIKRLRKCHGKVIRELNEVLKTALTSLAITAGITIAAIFTAGAFAPAIAVALVGSNFAGLSGAALTSAYKRRMR